MRNFQSGEVRRLLHLLAEQTTDEATMLLDPKGTVAWCNLAASRMFGYAPEAFIGLPVERLFTSDDVARGVPAYELRVAAESGDDMNNDRWMQRADGSTFWASGSTAALRDERGELIAFGKTLRNRTDVKEQIETLRNRVEALSLADEHKNIFLSTLSHELRNPLAPLANALQLIRMSGPTSEALHYPIKLIERQVEFIRRLVDDLLDMTRISSGKIQLELTPVDLKDVLGRAVEMSRPIIGHRAHMLIQHVLEAPIVIKGDSGRLEQVFVNLLNNAAKYTPPGGRIQLRATREQQEALVHVIDNGIGIPKEMQPHVFELFTQVPSSRAHADGGLGIGLSLVRNLVELHGGSVQVRSDGAGQGSEFIVRLPLAGDPPPPPLHEPQSSPRSD